MRLTQEYTLDIEHRFRYAMIAVAVLFVIITARLYYLQVIRGNFYHFFSTENSIKEIKIPAARGMIFDRKLRPLAQNRVKFDIVITPQYVVDPQRTLDSLSKLLQLPREELDAVWEKRKTQAHYQPLVVKSDVSKDEMAFVRARKTPWNDENDKYDLRGVDVEVGYRRFYPESDIAAHVLGYVKEIDGERLKRYHAVYPDRYNTGDMVGINGIEERYDLLLRGMDGHDERIVNAVGREVDYTGISELLSGRRAEAGTNLQLTIDRDLQAKARDLFAGFSGAVVAVDTATGGILAMFSSPSYDLNKLEGPLGSGYFREIAAGEKHSLLNRTIQGGYPPGSTFKIVTAIAALSEGVVKPDENIFCGGALFFGGRPYHCWAEGGHGFVSFHGAIVSSCDVYFYQIGLRLGVDRIAKYADILGFGSATGIPISGEKSGLVPTSEWKEKKFKAPWQEGETLSVSVGQSYNVVTPLQNALLAVIVANGGKRREPYLVEEAIAANGGIVYSHSAPDDPDTLPIDPEILKRVKAAMVGVVAEEGGTAHAQSLRKVTMGGKTGTAQVISMERAALCKGDECRDHAWFIGFAPADKPAVAAAAIVEHGGFGASTAAPIVGALLEEAVKP